MTAGLIWPIEMALARKTLKWEYPDQWNAGETAQLRTVLGRDMEQNLPIGFTARSSRVSCLT